MLNETTLTIDNIPKVLQDVLLVNMSNNELVIKNDTVKKAMTSFVFMERVQTPCYYTRRQSFYHQVLSTLYRNDKYNILANVKIVLSTL